jgi:hypothetical protein
MLLYYISEEPSTLGTFSLLTIHGKILNPNMYYAVARRLVLLKSHYIIILSLTLLLCVAGRPRSAALKLSRELTFSSFYHARYAEPNK